ncbi:hypothetical protein CBS101457_001468 [Exobasidium rhododendri]|nr:hypothetical protein CBS101457_001468 [Exobasidium rhododendri]
MSLFSIANHSIHGQAGRYLRHSLVYHARLCPSARLLSTTTHVGKSKKSFATEPPPATPADVPVIKTKGKGAKGASKNARGPKSKRGNAEEDEMQDEDHYKSSTTNKDLPGEKFDEEGLRANMERAVKRCKDTISQKVVGHGRADPAILDSVRITFSGQGETAGGSQSYSLKEFATIGVKDGALLITCFDVESMKHVERAIYESNVGLAPQQVPGTEGVLRLPVPRATAETRAALVKEVNKICENAKVSIRAARHSAQKQIKSDEKQKIIGTNEANGEMKRMEEETKKKTAEVDQIFERAKKQIEQG